MNFIRNIFLAASVIASSTICKSLDLKAPVITQKLVDSVNNNPESTWKAGFNSKFSTATIEEAKVFLGTKLLKGKDYSNILRTNTYSDEELAEVDNIKNFDLRDAYPDCESIKQIRDQSTCGSCWAFGAVEVMSDRICIKTKGKKQIQVSAHNLLSCCSTCGYGCEGGYPYSAFEYWSYNGIVSGGLYNDNNTCQPYGFPPCDHHTSGRYEPCEDIKPTPKCTHECSKDYKTSYDKDKTFGSGYFVGSGESKIKREIMANGSVECAFEVYEDFMAYKSGIYKPTSSVSLGGHAIKIIGWGEEKGVKYWLVANSWNEDWGEKGFFRYIRGNNVGGMEEECVAGLPDFKNSKDLEFLQ